MTEKRFKLHQHSHYGDGIEDTTKSDSQILIDSLSQCCELMNELNDENEQLKQFQEKVASVIESKMEDNVCNDYKMEVLKEIWKELNLDEVWFE